ncbi:hypothetical protein [uncultured Psychroserpens sp.]|uniref:hypothetical protein n=1 Tax=uncultured Psychroserpens sp. TaxID=255436 RepID=UPI0026109BDC|nr:hypothetical protein [uncultured Psychroserpens sp.]
MDDFYIVVLSVNQFLDGLFFGFSLMMILALIAYLFFKNVFIFNFIHHAIRVARILAIIYFSLYLLSTISYYSSSDFKFFSERAKGPYAWVYWLMLLRPLLFCGLIQLFWFKKIRSKMRYIGLLILPIAILTLFSGAMFEKLVIISASFHRDVISEGSQFGTDLFFILALHIIETCVVFSALVFVSWIIRKKTTS